MPFFTRHNGTHIPYIGPLENNLLDIVWTHGESSVHEVMSRLARPLAYTTVMTTLDRLYKKGLLERNKRERAFVYSPAISRAEWEQRRAGEFFASFLSGSASRDLLISSLVDAVGERDEALLEALESKIRLRRKELDQKKTP